MVRRLYRYDRMDVNVHAMRTKPTESRLIGLADFAGIPLLLFLGMVNLMRKEFIQTRQVVFG